MSDLVSTKRQLPEWRVTNGGKKKHLGGRWSMERVAQALSEGRSREFDLNDLARLVYGTTSKTFRDNVRRHIPSQRNFMMARMSPIVTRYGPRGTIEAIKLYEPGEAEDVRRLSADLQRLRDRKELTEEKYEMLRSLLLPSPGN